MSTRIVLDKLTKEFDGGGSRGVTAVNAVSLMIEPGELFFLLGPSGCGKTTLLRMIAGFIEPTRGTVVFEGSDGRRDVTYVPPNKRNTGMVFQSYALWPHMTVGANVAFGLDVRKVSGEEKGRRVREALAAVHMEEYEGRKPNQLSGGQQQRVALARALVIRPEVLLLDEPLSNLDAKLRVELRSEIRRICKEVLVEGVPPTSVRRTSPPGGTTETSGGGAQGITTVYVTHDQKEALSMADRVAVMAKGSVVQLGTPAELYSRPRTRFVAEFLGETNIIEGEVMEMSRGGENPRRVEVKTAAGRIVSGSVSEDLADGAERCVLSIRPEAVRVNAPDGTNNMFGRVVESTYLGETAQLVVETQGGLKVKAAVLNPGAAARAGEKVTLSVSAGDAVALAS